MRSADILTKRAQRLLDALPSKPSPRPEYMPPEHDAQQLQAFLSIDVDSLLDSADPLSRQTRPCTQYRHDRWLVMHHIEQERVCEDDLAKVRRWVEAFA